jgi:chorismate mutase/prephenate dehydratase
MNLESYREQIDRIDEQIIQLLNQRLEAAGQIGQIKSVHGQEIYSPEREKYLIERLDALNAGPLSTKTIRAIYREIMSAALALEKQLKIAFLGPEATFCHQASMLKFGSSLDYLPLANIADVFAEVEKGTADYGVVPVENSTEGVVTYTLDMFIQSELKICAELFLPIELDVMSSPNANWPPKRVLSHPQVFGQCKEWLLRNLPHAERIELSSTTRAAQRALEDPDSIAIASRVAAELYGLTIREERVQDSTINMTRFLVVAPRQPKASGHDKTSILFSVKDRVGALYDSLKPFMEAGINLTRIESRPSKRRAWQYFFFVDFLGHSDDPAVARVLDDLSNSCDFVKLLGSFPQGEVIGGRDLRIPGEL